MAKALGGKYRPPKTVSLQLIRKELLGIGW